MSAKGIVKLTLCKLRSLYLKPAMCGMMGRDRVPVHTGAVQTEDCILLSPLRGMGEDGALKLMIYLYYKFSDFFKQFSKGNTESRSYW